jgi:hypothetical protein
MESVTNHDNNETSNPLPPTDFSTTSRPVSYIWKQREFQKSILGYLENKSNLLKAYVNQ